MLQRSSEFPIARPAEDVVALLRVRPSKWLRGFLRLAAHDDAARTAAYVNEDPWYRLGEPIEVTPETVTANLVWWPHLNGDVFTTFNGKFNLVTNSRCATLSLVGVTDGGVSERNVAVLDRLLVLIKSALESSQDLVG